MSIMAVRFSEETFSPSGTRRSALRMIDRASETRIAIYWIPEEKMIAGNRITLSFERRSASMVAITTL